MIWQAMKYLRFACVQRNINLKDLDTEISDFKESRIVDDDHFSSEDVRELLDSLVTTIRADVYRDLQRMAHSTVVLLRQCMQQSAEHGISLTVDTGLLEDEKFLMEAKRMEEETERTPEALKELAPAGMGSVSKSLMKLPGLESAKTAEALSAENAILKQRLTDLQQDLVQINREKTKMSERLQATEAALSAAGGEAPPSTSDDEAESATAPPGSVVPTGGSGGDAARRCSGEMDARASAGRTGGEAGGQMEELLAKLQTVEAELNLKKSEVDSLEEQMQMKINQTPQFKSLNLMLQKKNEEMKLMRETLKGYGWKDPADE